MRIQIRQAPNCLNAQRSPSSINKANAAKIKLLAFLMAGDHLNENRRNNVQLLYLETLNSREECAKLEVWKNYDLVATIWGGVCHDDEPISVTKRKQPEQHLGVDIVLTSVEALKNGELYDVCDDVTMRNHDSFLFEC